MAEERKKSHHILLSTDGKNTTLELFDAREWPEKSCDDGEFRVRIDGRWHCPMGKYTFLSHNAVGELISRILAGEKGSEVPDPPQMHAHQSVRVHFGECEGSMPLRSERGFVTAPPILGFDGRWYAPVSTFGGTMYHLCHDIQAGEGK